MKTTAANESLKLDRGLLNQYRKLAKREGRTIKGQIELVMREYLNGQKNKAA